MAAHLIAVRPLQTVDFIIKLKHFYFIFLHEVRFTFSAPHSYRCTVVNLVGPKSRLFTFFFSASGTMVTPKLVQYNQYPSAYKF